MIPVFFLLESFWVSDVVYYGKHGEQKVDSRLQLVFVWHYYCIKSFSV